jgi:hypothetical protein
MMFGCYRLSSEAEMQPRIGTNVARVCYTAFLVIALSNAVNAQEPNEKPLHFDFSPFIGYRTSMSFLIEPHVSGTTPSIVLGASSSFGASFGVRLQEDGLVEVRWARQDSHFQSDGISPPLPRQHVLLDQFHGDFSREYTVDEWRPWAKPYALLSVGLTHTSGRPDLNFTRFSFGIGGGIRFYPSRHIGFKIQAEWLPVLVDPQVSVICGSGCLVHIRGTVGSQGEAFIGPVFRF